MNEVSSSAEWLREIAAIDLHGRVVVAAPGLYNPELDLTFMTLANHENTDETQPLAALLLMNAVVTTSTTAIPEPGTTAALVGALAFGVAGCVRRCRLAAQIAHRG